MHRKSVRFRSLHLIFWGLRLPFVIQINARKTHANTWACINRTWRINDFVKSVEVSTNQVWPITLFWRNALRLIYFILCLRFILVVGTTRALHSKCVPSHFFTTFLRCRCQRIYFALQKYNKIFIYARKKSLFLLKIWSIKKKAVPLSPQTAISSRSQRMINRIMELN